MSFFRPRTNFVEPLKGQHRIGMICWWVGCTAFFGCIVLGLVDGGTILLELRQRVVPVMNVHNQVSVIPIAWWLILVGWWLLAIACWLLGRALLTLLTRHALVEMQAKQQVETF